MVEIGPNEMPLDSFDRSMFTEPESEPETYYERRINDISIDVEIIIDRVIERANLMVFALQPVNIDVLRWWGRIGLMGPQIIDSIYIGGIRDIGLW